MASIIEFATSERVPLEDLTMGVVSTPVGLATVVWDKLGLRELSFNDRESGGLDYPPKTIIRRDDALADRLVDEAFAGRDLSLPLVLCGSEFQRRVWRALVMLKVGQTVSYGQLAHQLGKPGAARAVGSAVGANRLGFVVPCHRVVRQDGVIGQFRWGSEIKAKLLAWELQATYG